MCMRDVDAATAEATLVQRWFTAWNRADPAALRELLHLPHVGLQGPRLLIRESERALRERPELSTDFPSLAEREGWHRSTLDAVATCRPSRDKLHHAVMFGRYTQNGARYADGEAIYVAVRRRLRWAFQLSSGTLRPVGFATTDDEAAVAAAGAVVEEWVAAHDRSDAGAVARLAHLPHVEIRGPSLRLRRDRPELARHVADVKAGGWAHGGIVRATVRQRSPRKVAFEAEIRGWREDGTPLPGESALYIVTERDGRWGMQASSVLHAP